VLGVLPFWDISFSTAERKMEVLSHLARARHLIHCSGHEKGRNLFEIVKTIDAKMPFPIHTEHSELYVRATRNITVVEEGKSYSF
jgi:mRNA degradation ribonuclease J1/J2